MILTAEDPHCHSRVRVAASYIEALTFLQSSSLPSHLTRLQVNTLQNMPVRAEENG